jgi:Ca2+/Na+ antiporter
MQMKERDDLEREKEIRDKNREMKEASWRKGSDYMNAFILFYFTCFLFFLFHFLLYYYCSILFYYLLSVILLLLLFKNVCSNTSTLFC